MGKQKIVKHFSVTIVIVYKNKCLLHRHKKLGIWIPVGGHVDEDELPEEAAVREAREESGLDIELFNSDKNYKKYYSNIDLLIKPAHIELHLIEEYHHHINLVYYAKSNNSKIQAEDERDEHFQWFTKDELNNENINSEVKFVCKEALDILIG